MTTQEREKIRQLRYKGLTYPEIIVELGRPIPKSTLSYICRDVILPATYKNKIERLNRKHLDIARQKALAVNRSNREKLITSIRAKNLEFANLSEREAKIALAYLYLGEGSKRSTFRGLALGNSDPLVITAYIKLLQRCYDISPENIKVRILYRADQKLDQLESYWSEITGIPRNNFYKTKPDPRTIGRPTIRSDYKGVCVLYCKGADKQLELQIITDIIVENMGM